jgi:hypothetical protein
MTGCPSSPFTYLNGISVLSYSLIRSSGKSRYCILSSGTMLQLESICVAGIGSSYFRPELPFSLLARLYPLSFAWGLVVDLDNPFGAALKSDLLILRPRTSKHILETYPEEDHLLAINGQPDFDISATYIIPRIPPNRNVVKESPSLGLSSSSAAGSRRHILSFSPAFNSSMLSVLIPMSRKRLSP